MDKEDGVLAAFIKIKGILMKAQNDISLEILGIPIPVIKQSPFITVYLEYLRLNDGITNIIFSAHNKLLISITNPPKEWGEEEDEIG